ncbi:MAG: hypothetical protein J6R86_08855 [Lentisphaeria bacterium]|nr:hypothetical protein [Lentisphaeria bacterium]
MRIFKIFLVTALFAGVFTALRGETSLGSRCYLKTEYSGGKDGEFLFRIVRQAHQSARKSELKRPKKRTEFQINAKAWNVLSTAGKNVVSVPGTSADWQQSFEQRRILYGIVFRVCFDLDLPEEPDKFPFPVWMSAAMDEIMAGRRKAEQLSLSNKDYSAVRMIFKQCRQLPDFAALCRFNSVPEDPATVIVFRQQSRLLMEIATGMKLFAGMLQDHAGGYPEDRWLRLFATPREAQLQLTDNARKFLWGRRASVPEPLDDEALKKLQTIVIPALDKDGIPDGKMLELSFSEANKLFLTGTRPDLEEVRKYYKREWLAFSYLRSLKVRELALKLRDIAGQIGSAPEVAAEFDAVFKQLTGQLEWEKLQFSTFIKLSFIHLPVDQLYFWQFKALDAVNLGAGNGRTGEFLKATEKEYFENY